MCDGRRRGERGGKRREGGEGGERGALSFDPPNDRNVILMSDARTLEGNIGGAQAAQRAGIPYTAYERGRWKMSYTQNYIWVGLILHGKYQILK